MKIVEINIQNLSDISNIAPKEQEILNGILTDAAYDFSRYFRSVHSVDMNMPYTIFL